MKPKLLIIIVLLVILIPPILLFTPLVLNYDKSANNSFILDKNYSNLPRSEITARLSQDFVLPQSKTLTYDGIKTELNLATISARINNEKVASTILYRRLNQGILSYVKYFFTPKTFTLDISYDETAFNKYISDLSSQLNKPYIPSEFQIKSGQVVCVQGQIGREIDTEALKWTLVSQLANAKFEDFVEIKFNESGYLPSESEIAETKAKAQKLIGKNLVLTSDNRNITVDDKTLLSWLNFKNDYQNEKIGEYVKNTSQSLKRDPVNAVFKFENNKVTDFKPALPGLIPKEDELSALIKSSMDKLVSSEDKSISFAVPVKTIDPDIKTEDANDLGIKELLGRGTSTFHHSDSIRNMNIEKGAGIVNRILVAPGETFSFVKNLGEVSLEAGFKKAYIIRQGKTELDVGGGICQVSTTLFRAMLNAGVNITERRNHAYRVSYYEEDSKPGFDATVFIPSPDLKFINDTGHYVLIQNIFDLPNRTLTYEIYGTSDGRKSEISNYRQWDSAPPPPDIYIDDPTLPVGKVVQDEKRIPGLKTAFDWTVTDKDGSVIHKKTFQSNFTPWAAVYRRGTKI
jgi:vancomycin resistance protein YoaR